MYDGRGVFTPAVVATFPGPEATKENGLKV